MTPTTTIIGTGTMVQTIAGVFSRGGHEVQMLGSGDGDQPITGDVVVLAVPHAALAGIAAQRGPQLTGKIVIDITNPVDFETFDSLTVPADTSSAAVLAAALPESRVLKAFNTTFAATLTSGQVGDNPTTVLVAGDDEQAKALVIESIASGGLAAKDAGSLRRARELEALGFLQLTLAAAQKISWAAGFALVT